MPKGNSHERVTGDLGLFAYFLMHGLKKVSVRKGSHRRGYLLTYLDPENKTKELRDAYWESRERTHDRLVRETKREIYESARQHEQEQGENNIETEQAS